MYVLLNQAKETIAYLETNMILDAQQMELTGVLLGNCVFDRQGVLKGKIFGGIVYNPKGDQLAVAKVADNAGDDSFQQYLTEANNIVFSITNHVDIWIEPTGKWAKEGLLETIGVKRIKEPAM